jgi:hypothetical protein
MKIVLTKTYKIKVIQYSKYKPSWSEVTELDCGILYCDAV